MASSYFSIYEHTTLCQHIREYPNAATDDHGCLHPAFKQYRPLNNLKVEARSVTVIANHAIRFSKYYFLIYVYIYIYIQLLMNRIWVQETYEPLWVDLVKSNCNIPRIGESQHESWCRNTVNHRSPRKIGLMFNQISPLQLQTQMIERSGRFPQSLILLRELLCLHVLSLCWSYLP